jgi:hypothetical protein
MSKKEKKMTDNRNNYNNINNNNFYNNNNNNNNNRYKKTKKNIHLVFTKKFWRSRDIEEGEDAADGPVDDVGDDEGAEDGQPELVVAKNSLEDHTRVIRVTMVTRVT